MYLELQVWPLFGYHFVKFRRSVIHVKRVKCGQKELNQSTSLALEHPSGFRLVPSLEEAQNPQRQFRNRTSTPCCWMLGEKFSITKDERTIKLNKKMRWIHQLHDLEKTTELPWKNRAFCFMCNKLSEHPDRPPMATGKDVQRPRPEIAIDPPSGLDSRSAWFLVGKFRFTRWVDLFKCLFV